MAKQFTQPYIYNRPASKQEYKFDNTNLNMEMSSKINNGDISDILSFFDNNFNINFRDKENNTPIHLIITIDNNKLSEKK